MAKGRMRSMFHPVSFTRTQTPLWVQPSRLSYLLNVSPPNTSPLDIDSSVWIRREAGNIHYIYIYICLWVPPSSVIHLCNKFFVCLVYTRLYYSIFYSLEQVKDTNLRELAFWLLEQTVKEKLNFFEENEAN